MRQKKIVVWQASGVHAYASSSAQASDDLKHRRFKHHV